MRTLTITPQLYQTFLSAKGLSIKSAGYAGHDLCREGNRYYIANRFKTDPRTALISAEHLIKYLSELYEDFHFDKIKIKGHYEITADELYDKIKKE